MCIGIPMQIVAVEPGFAYCVDQGERRRISTLLVGECAVGEWLLVFLDDAREKIDAARAAEINDVLSMLKTALIANQQTDELNDSEIVTVPEFSLPSSMSVADIARLTDHGAASSYSD